MGPGPTGGDPGAAGAGSGAEGRGAGGETMRGPDAGTDRGDGGGRGKAAEQSGPPGTDADKPATRAEGKDGDKPATRAEGKDGADDKDADAGTKRAEDSKAGGGTSAEGKSTGEAGQDATGGAAGSLTGEKRTQVQKAFSSHRSDAKVDIDIDVSVGVVVPRHVHLVAIPEDIVVIVPAWRRYRYIVVGDTICIVDPDTFKIVEVIVLT